MNTIAKQGYRTTAQLLSKATKDSDAASGFVNGVDWETADCAIFVVKAPKAKAVYDYLVASGLITEGKRVVDRNKPQSEPPRCYVHGTVMGEVFGQQGRYMFPTGVYRCYQCRP